MRICLTALVVLFCWTSSVPTKAAQIDSQLVDALFIGACTKWPKMNKEALRWEMQDLYFEYRRLANLCASLEEPKQDSCTWIEDLANRKDLRSEFVELKIIRKRIALYASAPFLSYVEKHLPCLGWLPPINQSKTILKNRFGTVGDFFLREKNIS